MPISGWRHIRSLSEHRLAVCSTETVLAALFGVACIPHNASLAILTCWVPGCDGGGGGAAEASAPDFRRESAASASAAASAASAPAMRASAAASSLARLVGGSPDAREMAVYS